MMDDDDDDEDDVNNNACFNYCSEHIGALPHHISPYLSCSLSLLNNHDNQITIK